MRETLAAAVGLGLSLLGCGDQRAGAPPLGVSRESTVVAPVVSPDFALEPPSVTPRDDSPIVATATSSAGAHLILFNALAPDLSAHRLQSVLVSSGGQASAPVDLESFSGTFFPAAIHTSGGWLVSTTQQLYVLAEDGSLTVARDPVPSLTGLAWGNDRALVTTADGQGRFYGADGLPLAPAFTVASEPGTLRGGGVAFDGTVFLVLYGTVAPTTVFVASVLANGTVGDVEFVHNSRTSWDASQLSPAGIASSGSSFVVSFMAAPNSCGIGGACLPVNPFFRVADVTSGGTITLGSVRSGGPNVTYMNGHYAVYQNSVGSFLDADGVTISAPGVLTTIANTFWNVTRNSAFFLAAASDGSHAFAYQRPLVTRLDASDAPLDVPPFGPLPLPQTQIWPTVTFDGQQFVAAWTDWGRDEVRAARISVNGTALDSPAQTLSGLDTYSRLAVSNGTRSLLTVGDGTSDIAQAVLLEQNGAKSSVDLSGLTTTWSNASSSASDGANFFLVWNNPTIDVTPPRSFAALLSPTGTTLDQIDFPPLGGLPWATFDGTNYVVAYVVDVGGGQIELRAFRVSPALELVDSTPKTLVTYAGTVSDYGTHLASNGSGSLIGWIVGSPGGGGTPAVHYSRLSTELELLDAPGLDLGANTDVVRGLNVAWDGESYWVHYREVLGTSLRARRVAPNGTLVDAQPVVITDDAIADRRSSVAAAPDGKLLVAYQRAFYDGDVRGRIVSGRTANGGAGGSGGIGGNGVGGTSAGSAGSAGTAGTAGTNASGGTAGATGGGATGGAGGTAGTSASGESGGGGEGGATGETGGAAGEDGSGGSGGSGGRSGSGGRGGASNAGTSNQGGEAGEATGGSATAGTSAGGRASGGAGGVGGGGGAGRGGAGTGGGSNPPDDGGCSCSVPARRTSSGAWVLALGGLAAGARRRRARERSRAPQHTFGG